MNSKQNTVTPHQQIRRDRERVTNIHDEENPIRMQINKLLGEHRLTAVIEEDQSTLATMSHVPGIVSFLCTLVGSDKKVLAQGRGSNVINPTNKWAMRSVNNAFHSAIVDAVMRATKVLGTFTVSDYIEENATPKITEKQSNYLRELIRVNVHNSNERERQEAQINELTKQEASELIASYMK